MLTFGPLMMPDIEVSMLKTEHRSVKMDATVIAIIPFIARKLSFASLFTVLFSQFVINHLWVAIYSDQVLN